MKKNEIFIKFKYFNKFSNLNLDFTKLKKYEFL